MMKIVAMSIGGARVLVETDNEGIVVSSDEQVASHIQGIPKDMTPVGATDALAVKFEEVQELIKICCLSLLDTIKEVNEPDSIGVEFGIKLSGEMGVPMISKASGEANFKISLEWKKPVSAVSQ
jgi:hypothetical protein